MTPVRRVSADPLTDPEIVGRVLQAQILDELIFSGTLIDGADGLEGRVPLAIENDGIGLPRHQQPGVREPEIRAVVGVPLVVFRRGSTNPSPRSTNSTG